MSASNAIHGFGTLLQVADDASPADFTTIAELMSVKPGKMSTAVLEKTHHESPNTHREKLAGLKDTAATTIQGNYLALDATQGTTGKGLAKLWKDRTVAHFRAIVSDGIGTTYITFDAFVSGLEVGDMNVNDPVKFTAELTPVTQMTLP
jgi:hypothetical protein